jgi:hypothetical protein
MRQNTATNVAMLHEARNTSTCYVAAAKAALARYFDAQFPSRFPAGRSSRQMRHMCRIASGKSQKFLDLNRDSRRDPSRQEDARQGWRGALAFPANCGICQNARINFRFVAAGRRLERGIFPAELFLRGTGFSGYRPPQI